MLHLKEIIGGPLNMLANLMTMRWTIKKCSQDEHVQRALKKSNSFCHRRRSTLDLSADGRHSTVNCQEGTFEGKHSISAHVCASSCSLPSIRPPIAVANSMIQISIPVFRTLGRFTGLGLRNPRTVASQQLSLTNGFKQSLAVLE